MDKKIVSFFRKNVVNYYLQNKRDLPWRNTNDPYKIWISEIILQQTQVKQGMDYYNRFIKQFPDVVKLANAKEDEILHLWQGLGYYTRARNLHIAAKQIAEQFDGKFPSEYEKIKQLKGIGEYTAAAIASFAFNLPYAVLDGNVFRVLSRFFLIDIPIDTANGKKYFSNLAQQLLDKKNPAVYNQAIMEFGATWCKPVNPDCHACLLNTHCGAFHQNKVQLLPVKSRALQKRKRFFNYIVFIENNQYTYLQKREKTDIWQGLYEFYLIENKTSILSQNDLKKYLRSKKISCNKIISSDIIKHVLSHQELFIQFNTVYVLEKINIPGLKRVAINKIHQYAFPVVIKRYVERKL